jgi:Zn-finger nucleic acid-binding protein
MICPACHRLMVQEDFGDVHVDVCKNGCKSLWFDWLELEKLDEYSEGFGEFLEEVLAASRVHDRGRGKLNCPKCGTPMYLHKYKRAKEVNVDECVSCGGFFLDSGELAAIRDNFMNEAEHQAYTKKLLADVPGYGVALETLEKKKARDAAVGSLTGMFSMSPTMRRIARRRMRKKRESEKSKSRHKDQSFRIAELKEQLKNGLISPEEFTDKTAAILSESE